jgi:hypothetical protein
MFWSRPGSMREFGLVLFVRGVWRVGREEGRTKDEDEANEQGLTG